MKWTPQQQQAIESRGGALLVSAAAGSGKTAVLVERVLQLLTDPAAPCGADELLIVTFTRAAAAQMRERIDKALSLRLQAQPDNTLLLRQQQQLPLAQICTIDKFCLRLVKEHGPARGLPQQLRLMDDSERMLLRAEAADEALEAAYHSDSPAFSLLGLLLEVSGDDTALKKLLQSAAEEALASPVPEAWLCSLLEEYTLARPASDSLWGRLLMDFARDQLQYCRDLAHLSLEALADEPLLYERYAPSYRDALEYLDLLSMVKDWDSMREGLQAFHFEKLSAKPRGYNSPLAEFCKLRRELIVKAMKALVKQFCASAAEHAEDMEVLPQLAKCFVALVRDFLARCAQKKSKRQAAEFGDILHYALDLLIAPDGSKTELAQTLTQQFREILVDEYQDVNAAQARLFEALSREGANLFLVGDVKQSIYGFRQANPTLFLEKRSTYAPYDGKTYPACLILGRNFRSKEGVTDAVNFVFRRLMSARAADIEYSAEEALVCGREAPRGIDAELHLLEFDREQCDSAAAEAAYLARWIAAEQARLGLRWRDFCILLRSANRSGAVYAQALQALGIPAHAAETASLFQSREIQLLLSLLRIIDNPVQDIPLTAILLSPIGGFSEEDMARLRSEYRAAPGIYHCIRAAANAGDSACAGFLARLAEWRRMAAVCAVGDLVRFLLEDSGLLALTGAMRHPARRRANLHRLADYAVSSQTGGLSGFLRFIDQVEAEGKLEAVNVVSEAANVVRVMSIHKSKGLEFPVCILAQCAKRFNAGSEYSALLLDPRQGLGLQRPVPETRSRLRTLPHTALQRVLHRSMLAEELRMLYVAMTRAQDRLILLASAKKGFDKPLAAAAAKPYFERMPPAMVHAASSYADWLLPVFIHHPDAHALRHAAGADTSQFPPAQRMKFVRDSIDLAQSADENVNVTHVFEPNEALTALVQERLDYRYPHEALNRLAAKRGVSELTEHAQNEAFAFSSRPAFARSQRISAAQRGVAMHAFLQYADFSRAAADLDDEIARLQGLGYLAPRDAEALEREKLSQFFESPFAARMLASPRILREKKFTLRIPAAEFAGSDPLLLPESLEGETVVVQGIIDCAFEEDGALVLLDYKTDRIASMEILLERYSRQLQFYRRAMGECFGMETSQTLIYSFWLGSWVDVA